MTRAKDKAFPVLNTNPDMLEGLSAIASFIGKSPNTAASWITKHGLPATKLPNGRWLTHKSLVLQWIYAGHRAEIKKKQLEGHKARDFKTALQLDDVAHDKETIEQLAAAMQLDMSYEEIMASDAPSKESAL